MSSFFKVVRTFLIGSVTVIAIALLPITALATRPKPPDTATPSGNSTPGTTRPEAACPTTSKPLTALVANQGKDFTIKDYPTFFFYVPYTPEQISLMEFLILNATQTKTIFHSSVKLTDKPGIIRIEIPPEVIEPLETDTTYHWRFNLDCNPDKTTAPDLVLNGWIRRVTVSSDVLIELELAKSNNYSVYQNYDLWHDAIANLAELSFINHQDSRWNKEWHNLLSLLKLDWIIEEPLVSSEIEF